MKRSLSNRLNSIRAQITIAFFTLIVIIIALEFLAYSRIKKLPIINVITEDFSKLQKEQLYLKSQANEFIIREKSNAQFFHTGESESLKKYQQSLDTLMGQLNNIRNQARLIGIYDPLEFTNLEKAINAYDAIFQTMVSKIKERGFGSYGIIGEFDNAIRDLVQYDFGVDNVAVLNLQLFVKDYLLTGNQAATKNLKDEIFSFSMVMEKYITDDQVDGVVAALAKYEEIFNKLAAIDEELGTYSGEGLQDKLYIATEDIDRAIQLPNTHAEIERTYSLISSQVFISFFLVIGAALIAAFTISVRLNKTLVVPIQKIKKVVVSMGEGEIPEKLSSFKLSDVNEMSGAVNNLISGMKDHHEFANNIGKGNLTASFKLLNEKDVLGKALLEMRDNLYKLEEENKQRGWITQGIAQFADILRYNNNDLKILGDHIVSKLVKYLNVNQAGLYLINDDEPEDTHIQLVSCYAFERKKFVEQRLEIGQGLLGQALLEKESVYLTTVPKDYVRITSGLGQATPKILFIAPLKQNEIVLGALEIASLTPLEEYQRQFIEKIAESIASTIATVKINERNKRLLHESEERAQVMKAQEEELRQQMEELHATQEQMKRKEKETSR